MTQTTALHQSHSAHLRDIFRIGVPLIGGHLAQFAIGLTDTIMIGWYGVEELAALVLGSSMFFLIFLVGSGFAWAVMPLVAAAHDAQTIRRVTRMGLWLSSLFGVLCIPIMWFASPLLQMMGQEEKYLKVSLWINAAALLGLAPLVWFFGIMGAAFATGFEIAATGLLGVYFCRTTLEIDPSVMSLIKRRAT